MGVVAWSNNGKGGGGGASGIAQRVAEDANATKKRIFLEGYEWYWMRVGLVSF